MNLVMELAMNMGVKITVKHVADIVVHAMILDDEKRPIESCLDDTRRLVNDWIESADEDLQKSLEGMSRELFKKLGAFLTERFGDTDSNTEADSEESAARIETGLCDDNGEMICIGDVVQRKTEMNTKYHGEWVHYRVETRGMVPVLSYLVSQKGQVLPVGCLMSLLSDLYEPNPLLFSSEITSVRPGVSVVVVNKEATSTSEAVS